MIIYLVHCIPSEKYYVGQTCRTLAKRWRNNLYSAKNNEQGCTKLLRAIRKYGSAAFEKYVIAEVQTQEHADRLEKLWIILLRTQDHRFGYNITEGGRGLSGFHHSEETKKKLSIAHLGKQHRLGQHNTPEANAKLSAARKGNVVVSDEQREAISKANTGNNYHLGHRHSPEVRAKISASCLAAVQRRKGR